MLERTKKPLIDLHIKGPEVNKNKLKKILLELEYEVIDPDDELVPWREVFPKEMIETESGSCLAGLRHRDGLTQKELSKITGIPRPHISQMENGKRSIGKKIAKILAKHFDINYRVFL